MDIFHILRAKKVVNILIQTTKSLTKVYLYTFNTNIWLVLPYR